MRFYRSLLGLYPSAFRKEYGEEMCAVFARRLREASGPSATAALWAGAFLDTVASAVRVHGDYLRQDLRYTARTLGRTPGFAFTAILVAALGVGAVTAAFSITDHVLIRPLPFPDPERLVDLWETDTVRAGQDNPSPANFRDWKRFARSFSGMGAYRNLSMNLVGSGAPERVEGVVVTADLLPILGAHPELGRLFLPQDDLPGAGGTVLLSHRLWKARFGGDPDVLGRKVVLDDLPYVIVGVMPPAFLFPRRDVELWTTLRLAENDFADRTDTYLCVVGRLRQGVSLDAARSEMRLIAGQLERAYPKSNRRVGVVINRLRDEVSGQARLLLKALFGAALAVMLIACTNLASLLLARGLARRRELAVRTALGAGRERLVRQLLTESLVLAACGGALGVAIAAASGSLLARLVPNSLPIGATPPLDLRMLAVAALLTVATGIGFGVVPSLRTSRGGTAADLTEGSRAGAGRRTERLRAALVVAEVTASVALLIASGLLIRALWRLQNTDPGFRSDGVLTLRTSLPMPKYQETKKRVLFYSRVLFDVRRLPGVSSAAYISFLPMAAKGGIWSVMKEERPQEEADALRASMRFLTPEFFATMEIPLRLGRDVADTDTRDAPSVAVVSERLARRLWPGANPLGRRIRVALENRTVVGVVGEVRVRGLERASEPQVYLSAAQVDDGNIIGYVPQELAVRSAVSPGALAPAIAEIVARVDPQLPVSDVRPLSDIVDAETAPRRIQVRVLGAFAAVAFLLAGIGIHGLLAFAVSQRSREIGVRMALGAGSQTILKMIVGRGTLLAGLGIALGSAGAYAAGRAMQALLAGVSPADAPTFAAAMALSVAMTLLGSVVPALRALRVDPVVVLRAD